MTQTAEELFWEVAEDLQAEDPRVVEGTMMGGRCLRINGQDEPFAPAKKVFKEWISIPQNDREPWKLLIIEGIAFIS